MKKCLHVLPMNKLSGAEKLALILCENLTEYEPIVVCGGEELQQIFRRKGIKSYNINFSFKFIKKIMEEIADISEDNNIEIIHAHDNKASLISYLSKKMYMLDVKIISHIHSCYPWLKNIGINKVLDRIIRNRYDINIACGNHVKDFYLQNTKYINKDKFEVISNAIDINDIEIKNTKSIETYKKYKVPTNKKVIGYVGRLVELKGLIPFIKEFNNYKHYFKDSVILLVGSGDQEEKIKELIKSLKIEEYFILTGNQENIYEIYPMIDIFILPSKYEGLPMVILEAMGFNIPVVAMNVGSIKELVKNETNGYLIENNDYKDFILKLKELKNDEKRINSYGEQGFKIIKESYNISNYAKIVEKIYNEVI